MEGHGLHGHGTEFWAWVRGCLGLWFQRLCSYGPHRRGTKRNQVCLALSSQPRVAGCRYPVLDPFYLTPYSSWGCDSSPLSLYALQPLGSQLANPEV